MQCKGTPNPPPPQIPCILSLVRSLQESAGQIHARCNPEHMQTPNLNKGSAWMAQHQSTFEMSPEFCTFPKLPFPSTLMNSKSSILSLLADTSAAPPPSFTVSFFWRLSVDLETSFCEEKTHWLLYSFTCVQGDIQLKNKNNRNI